MFQIAFKQAKVADPALLETLYDVYPQMNWTGAAYYGRCLAAQTIIESSNDNRLFFSKDN